MSFHIWKSINMIAEAMALNPEWVRPSLVALADTHPDIVPFVKNIASDPLYNYEAFKVNPGTLPNGDVKSSPVKFHEDESKQRIIVTGNRCSKTYSGAAEVLSACVGMDPISKMDSDRFKPPIEVWVVSDTEDSSIEVVQSKYFELCPKHLLSPACDYNPRTGWKNNVIEFKAPFHSLIRFRYSSQGAKTFQGPKRELIHLDEEQPEEVDDECVARTAGVGGPPGEIIRTFTPIYRESVGISWIHPKLYTRRSEIPSLSFHFWTLWDMPDWIIPAAEKSRIVASYDEDNRDTRVFGLFQPSGIRLAFAASLIAEQRKLCQREGQRMTLNEEEYEVEVEGKEVRFSRDGAQPTEMVTKKRVVAKEVA